MYKVTSGLMTAPWECVSICPCGGMVDTLVLGTSLRVGVRVPPWAPFCFCRLSSVGLEHLPTKQGAGSSSLSGGTKFDGDCSSVGRVSDCDSDRRGFESHQSPHIETH